MSIHKLGSSVEQTTSSSTIKNDSNDSARKELSDIAFKLGEQLAGQQIEYMKALIKTHKGNSPITKTAVDQLSLNSSK